MCDTVITRFELGPAVLRQCSFLESDTGSQVRGSVVASLQFRFSIPRFRRKACNIRLKDRFRALFPVTSAFLLKCA